MNKKYILAGAFLILNVFLMCLLFGLINAYLLTSINFPTGTGNMMWSLLVFPFFATIPGLPLLAMYLVRKRDIGYLSILGLCLVPYGLQAIMVYLYEYLGDIYGYVCC